MPANAPMNRLEFLQLFGLGATALLATGCLAGCSKKEDPIPGASGVDFTLDLSAAATAPLQDPATGYVYNTDRSVVVAKTTAGTYIAVQAPCPHQGTTVYFSPASSQFICPNHNAIFDVGGAVLSGPAPRALKQYTVAQTGTTLRITG